MYLFIALVMTCIMTASSAFADRKPAWEWTAAERAAARRDPAKRLQRLHAHEAEQKAALGRTPLPSADVIDGGSNPELFFVTELFEILVRSAFVSFPGRYYPAVRQRSSDLFRDPAEWERFIFITTEYADVLEQERAAANAGDKTRVSSLQALKCAAAARALRESHRTFGRARFDRMLYETVTPGLKTTFSMDTDFNLSINKALEREEMCQ